MRRNKAEATGIIKRQHLMIREHRPLVCEQAAHTKVDRSLLWQRQILHPFAFEAMPDTFHRFE